MPTTLDHLRTAIGHAITTAFPDLYDADPQVVPTTNDAFGDYQCNAAMAIAKRLKQKPRDVATALTAVLGNMDGLAGKVDVAGPGFINLTLATPWVEKRLAVNAADPRLGLSMVDHPQTVVVDYSGVNVAKQMHVGHLRSTIIGDAIARVLAFQGHTVIRQNHIGDWGTQFGMLIAYIGDVSDKLSTSKTDTSVGVGDLLANVPWADSLELVSSIIPSHDNDGPSPKSVAIGIGDLDTFYKSARQKFDSDTRFADHSREAVVKLQAGGKEQLDLWRKIVAESRRHFQPIYDRLGVQLTPAEERGESFYNPMLASDVADLRAAGVAVESDGATVAFTPGVEAPLILEKTGGGFGYATTDLAAVRYRVGTLGATRVIYFVGAPQAQHFKQVFDTARRAGWATGAAGDASLEHAAFGSVLGGDGKMLKTRSGEAVKLADLLDEAEQRALAVVTAKSPELPAEQRERIAHAVGIGAVKYADLSKDRLSDYTFDFDAMLSMDGNTAPYLQYAYARVRSIFRKAGDGVVAGTMTLDTPEERALGVHLLRLGEILDVVARDLKPHVLCQYLYDTATKFSRFFENCPVLKSDEPTRGSRLALCDFTGRTLALGLDLLGIEHPEQL